MFVLITFGTNQIVLSQRVHLFFRDMIRILHTFLRLPEKTDRQFSTTFHIAPRNDLPRISLHRQR